jgi:transcriptional regulator with XRE-family HTH domain
MSQGYVGDLLREWRHRRNRSQLELAIEVGVSARHLSFVETGRARPSPELVLAVAAELDVPLRERNTMLLAAGYAPRYSETSLDDEAMAGIRTSLQRMLDAHDPYPGVVIDRAWNVLLANDGALALTAGVPDHLLSPSINVFRIGLHPDGLGARTANFDDWAGYLLRQLRRTIQLTGDAQVEDIEREVLGYPNVAAVAGAADRARWDDPPLLVPFTFVGDGVELSMFTTLTTFGTPRDITLDELAVELFFPADEGTARHFAAGRMAGTV